MASLDKGPCSELFWNLEACAADKKSKNPKAKIDNPKAKMLFCPRQTDELIKCIKKHPRVFQQQS